MEEISVTCPLCGNKMHIESSMRECWCVACGTKLITAALNKEPAGDRGGEEPPAKERRAKPKFTHFVEAEETEAEINAPELTQEEISAELEKKAQFKQELKHTVRRIDELRSRRKVYSSQKDVARILISVGAVSIVGAAAVMLLFRGPNGNVPLLTALITAALALLGVVSVIVGAARMGEVKRQRARLEESIREHKEKRDVLIGRLNKINKKLHIHHDHHEHHEHK